MDQQAELVVLVKFYSVVQKSITDAVSVASLLRQEEIASDSVIDAVSAANSQSEKTTSIMRHVEAAVRVNPQSFWKFIAVLEKSGPPACHVAQKMRNAVDLQEVGKQDNNDLSGRVCSIIVEF